MNGHKKHQQNKRIQKLRKWGAFLVPTVFLMIWAGAKQGFHFASHDTENEVANSWTNHSIEDALSGVKNATDAKNLRKAPRFELPDDRGVIHRLADLRGQMIILHFWASWCGPCVEDLGQWLDLARRFESQPIHWISISVDEKWEDAFQILSRQKLPANVLSVLDSKSRTSDQYGTYQYPETYLISPDLRIIFKWVGPQDWGSLDLEKFGVRK